MKIDINCDVGEGLNNEHEIMPLISSCNIACGAHAGSEDILQNVLKLAKEHNVKVGAHPSYPDRLNFGRKIMDITNERLAKSLLDQLKMFKNQAEFLQIPIHHVKAHGALYNVITVNESIARLFTKIVKDTFGKIYMYVPYGSMIENIAKENGMPIIYEAFADRAYNDDLTLVSRAYPYGVITQKEKVLTHVSSMINDSRVKTVQGNFKEIKAQTFCLHGDNRNVIVILMYLHQHLNIV